jgi:hypothetical protein
LYDFLRSTRRTLYEMATLCWINIVGRGCKLGCVCRITCPVLVKAVILKEQPYWAVLWCGGVGTLS